ncbi:MAG: GGDEF domain-containing protein [Deltaproteobacteria bacterium]|nr:GGDEF domain-containing protein [Deltaproteobacteria bacterium]
MRGAAARTAEVSAAQDRPTQRMPCLVVLGGREQGRVIPLGRPRMLVGSAPRVDIRLDDRGVSRRHAALRLSRGQVLLEDLGSTNGSWHNGKRVHKAVLRDGDRLQIGACRLALRFNHPEEGRLLRQLYFRATRDALTGLHNRASLHDRLERELARHARYSRSLALVQLDLDRFKRINDEFGHPAGDKVLILVAEALRGCLRRCDLAARVGGEEFVVVLPETGQAQALALAEKMRKRIEAVQVVHKGQKIGVSASLGVASPRGKQTTAELLEAVDQACYRAKQSGRNRVCG